MKYFLLGNPRTIEGMKEKSKFNIAIGKVRGQFNIAVIDDEGFNKENELRKRDYKITVYNDLEHIDDLKRFDIVLCDIKGVGKKILGEKGDGAKLIEEIRKYYPEKYIIAFSGETHQVNYNKYFSQADTWITKDEDDNDKWVDLFDTAIKDLLNHVHFWNRVRFALLNNGVSIVDVMKLEDSFVTSIEEKTKSFPPANIEKSINKTIYTILTNIASSAAFKLLTGGF